MTLFEVLSKNIEDDWSSIGDSKSLEKLTDVLEKKPLTKLKRDTLSFETQVRAGKSRKVNKPVLQLNSFPVTLNPKDYENALSNENPNGTLTSLWAFRQLVDPIPNFSEYYSSSSSSTESVFRMIINGISTESNNIFVEQVIADLQQKLNDCTYHNIDGIPGTWCPVHATPSDWYNTGKGRYKSLSFDLEKSGEPSSPFAIIGNKKNENKLHFTSSENENESKVVDDNTKVHSIKMKYLEVTLGREWYDDTIFNLSNWKIEGQQKGFCSSGKLNVNNGIFTLVPTSVILGCDVEVNANWSKQDQKKINDYVSKGSSVSINNIAFSPDGINKSIQVIGWVCNLIPFSPPDE